MKWLLLIAVGTSATILASGAFSGRGSNDPAADRVQVAAGASINHDATVSDGSVQWNMDSYRDTRGELCVRQNIPGEGNSYNCIDPRRLFADGHSIYVTVGGRQKGPSPQWDNIWLSGFVSPNVASLELVNMDCSVTPVHFNARGAFLVILGEDAISRGLSPYQLIGRDSGGAVIDTRGAAFPLPPQAPGERLTTPSPGAACA